MERFAMDKLLSWKDSPLRKPLILNGARQVGKTWLLKEFGNRYFDKVAYVNFDNNAALSAQFEQDFNLNRILLAIQVQTDIIIEPDNTLLIMDEIQECPKAISCLKYFAEEMPALHLCAAGSLLGITLHEGTGFPVGKVAFLNLYPLSFREFLDAMGRKPLREALDSGDWNLLNPLSTDITPYLRQYYYLGGMPEAVEAFISTNSFEEVRTIQEGIIKGYESDISKHLSIKDTEAVLSAFRSLPAHLSQENKRFVFGHIKEGARARDYRKAITWMTKAGIATKVSRISKAGFPLSGYANEDIFKLFFLDVGLLGAMTGLEAKTLIEENKTFVEFKGALSEQYVCQQLISDCGMVPYYWSAQNSQGEIDFIVQAGRSIYPIEVKAAENVRAKSLSAFAKRFPETKPRRFSLSDFREESWMINVPLWAIGKASNWE